MTSRCIGCCLFLLLLTAERLPAPISEEPTPTPAAIPNLPPPPPAPPAQSPAAAVPGASVAGQPLPHFAGKWIGTIKEGKFGDIDLTLVFNGDATALQQISQKGAFMRATTRNGNAISWNTGAKNEVSWTFALNPDGKTGVVTRKFANQISTATFRRPIPGESPTAPPEGSDQNAKKKRHRGR